MALPQTTVTVKDGNLGLVPASPGQTIVTLGPATAGTKNLLTAVATKQDLVATFGSGPLVDATALKLDLPGHGPIFALRPDTSTAGVAGSVSKTLSASAAGVPTSIGNGNSGVTYTANQSGVTVAHVDPQVVTANTTVAVVNKAITVTLKNTTGNAVDATADQVRAAVAASAQAMALLSSVSNTGDGTGVAATAGATALPFGSSGSVSVSGAPSDAFLVRLVIVKSGTVNVGSFTYSLDGGDSISPETAIPLNGTFAIPGTGLTLTWTPGAGPAFFQSGDSFSFDCQAPAMTLGDLATAFDALTADPRTFGMIHVLGAISPTVFSSLAVYAASLENAKKYTLIITEAAPPSNQTDAQWSAALISAYANSASIRLAVCANEAEVLAPVSAPQAGRVMKRNSAWVLAARAASVGISEDIGKVLSGPLLGCSALYQASQVDTLDSARFSTAYTIPDYEGFYGQGRLMAPSGSDFVYWQDIRVISEAQRLTYKGLVRYQSSDVRVRLIADPNTGAPAGSIDEADARAMEDALNASLEQNLVKQGHCTSAVAQIIRTDNLISLKKLRANVMITPKGYLKALEATVSLVNPQLVVVK